MVQSAKNRRRSRLVEYSKMFIGKFSINFYIGINIIGNAKLNDKIRTSNLNDKIKSPIRMIELKYLFLINYEIAMEIFLKLIYRIAPVLGVANIYFFILFK